MNESNDETLPEVAEEAVSGQAEETPGAAAPDAATMKRLAAEVTAGLTGADDALRTALVEHESGELEILDWVAERQREPAVQPAPAAAA